MIFRIRNKCYADQRKSKFHVVVRGVEGCVGVMPSDVRNWRVVVEFPPSIEHQTVGETFPKLGPGDPEGCTFCFIFFMPYHDTADSNNHLITKL